MSRCSLCGVSLPVNALFCPDCGSDVPKDVANNSQSAEVPAISNSQPDGRSLGASYRVLSGEEMPFPENIVGVVAYVTIIPAVIFLFLEPFKRNLFVRFHSFQHLLLWVAGLVVAIGAGILSAILQLIPFMRVLIFPLGGLISLAWFFLWILLVVKAYQHEMFKLPIVGDLAQEWATRD